MTSIEPCSFFREYTSFGADIDLYAEGPSATLSPKPRFARYIRVVAGSGTLAVQMPAGNATLTLAAGDFEVGEFQKVLATGTGGMTRIRVGW